jgi:hypothetical protein
MTATEPASLDALLASTPPQPYQPEDLGGLLDVVQRNYGLGQHVQDRYRARDRIMQHVNGLRVDVERARLVAVELENENAAITARTREALAYLGDALLWCEDRDMNVADCVSEAIAALKGDES